MVFNGKNIIAYYSISESVCCILYVIGKKEEEVNWSTKNLKIYSSDLLSKLNKTKIDNYISY